MRPQGYSGRNMTHTGGAGAGMDAAARSRWFNVQSALLLLALLTGFAPGAAAQSVDIGSASVTVAEDGDAEGGTAAYTVELGTQPAGNVEITVASDTATAATVSPLMLTFTSANWNAVQTVTVTGVDDDTVGERTASIGHSIESGDGMGYPDDGSLIIASVDVTITDDDAPVVDFAKTEAVVDESSGTHDVVVNLSPAQTSDTTITYTVIITGTAIAGEDYAALSGMVVVPANMTSADLSVVLIDDSVPEDNALLRLRLTAGEGYTLGSQVTYDLIIRNDDAAGVTITEADADTIVAEAGGTNTYSVVLDTQPSDSVEITATSDTATAATVSPTTLTFTTANWNTAQIVTVTGMNNDRDDAMDARTATISHGASSTDTDYGASLEIDDVEVEVTDDDMAGVTISETDADTIVTEAAGTDAYGVVLDTQPDGNVEITATSGTATAATVSPTTLTFTSANWNTAQTVTVTGVDDDVDNTGDERTASIGHRISSGDSGSYPAGGLSLDSVSVTVTDDDTDRVDIGSAVVTVGEDDGTAMYTVELGTRPAGNVEITVASDTATAATVNPLVLTFTMTNWDTAQTVTVTGVDDVLDNPGDERTASIGHSISSGDSGRYPTAGLSPASVDVTVTDDDTRGVAFDLTPGSTDVADRLAVDEGDTASYTAVLTTRPTGAVTVTITGHTGTDLTPAPASLTFTASDWNTEQTVTVTAAGDGDADNERIVLTHTLSGADYGAVAAGLVEVDITDAFQLTVSTTAVTVGEAGGTAMYTVELGRQPAGTVELTVASDTDTAATVSPTTLRFTSANWNTAQRVTVTGVDDDIDNAGDARMATLTHRVSSGDGAGYPTGVVSPVTVSATVTDDDTRGLMFDLTPGSDDDVSEVALNEGDSASYTAVLTSEPTGAVTVAIMGHPDLTPAPGSLTFTASDWDTEQTVTVTATDDANAIDERIVLTHTASGADYDAVQGEVAVDIEDTFPLSVAAAQVAEGGDLEFTVSLRSPAPAGGLQIRYATVDGRGLDSDADYQIATGGVDYTVIPASTLTIAEGDSEATITVSTTDDNIYESAHYLTLMLNDIRGQFNVGGTTATFTLDAAVASAVGTITDLDDRPTVEFDMGTFSVSERNSAEVRVRRASRPVSLVPTRVTFTIRDSTATRAGGDYAGPDSITLFFPPHTATQTFSIQGARIPILQNNVFERSKSFIVILDNNLEHVTLGFRSLSAVTILDDDQPRVGITADMNRITEGATATFTLEISNPAQEAQTFRLRLTTQGDFITPATVPVVLPAGQTRVTYRLPTVGDNVDESDGRVTVEIPNSGLPVPTQWTIRDGRESATVMVLDDDGVPTVGIAADHGQVSESDGARAVYTVTVSPPPSGTLDVSVVVSEDSDFIAETDERVHTVTIDSSGRGQLSLPLVNDGLDEADGMITAAIATDDAYRLSRFPDEIAATVEVWDDDGTTPGLAIASGASLVFEGSEAFISLLLTTAPREDVTVTISGHADTGLTLSPSSLTFTSANWNTDQDVFLNSRADANLENEMVTLTYRARGDNNRYDNVRLDTVITLVDSGTAVGVTLSRSGVTVNEASGTGAYTVVLDTQPTGDVEIAVTSTDESVATVAPASLSFTTGNWNTAQTVTVTGIADTVHNLGDRREASISHAISTANDGGGYTAALEIDEVTVTVTDDDGQALILAPAVVSITEGVTSAARNSYRVRLTDRPSANVTVVITGNPSGLTLSRSRLTFTRSNWNREQAVTLISNDDNAVDEVVMLRHTPSGGGYSVADAVTVMVTDIDETGLNFTAERLSMDENGSVSYAVTLASEPTAAVTVRVSDNPDHLMLSRSSLTFTTGNWNTAQTITLTGSEDSNAVDDTLTLTHTASGGDYDGVTGEVSVTVEEDRPSLALSESLIELQEGDSGTYTVVLTEQPVATVEVAITGDLAGLMRSRSSLSFTRGNWNRPQEITLTALEDSDGASAMGRLAHAASSGGFFLGVSDLQVRVADDEAGLVFSSADLSLIEDSSTAYTVRLAGAPTGTVNVAISASVAELSPQRPGIEFTPTNWMVPQRVTVSAGTDTNTIDDRATLTHTASGGGYDALTGELPVTLIDSGRAANVIVSETAVTVDEAGGTAGYTVLLASPPVGEVVITATTDMPSVAAVSPVRLSFTTDNWQVPQAVTVTGINDDSDNPGDSRTATIAHAIAMGDGGAYPVSGLSPAALTVTVTDDDDGDTPALVFAPAIVSVTEGAATNYTVALSTVPTASVTVAISGDSGTDLTLDGMSLTFTTVNWDTPQTVMVSAGEDDDMDDDRVMLTHTASAGGYNSVTGQVAVRVTDDDFLLSLAAATVAEGGDLEFTVTLPTPAAGDLTVSYVTTAGRGIAADADYRLATGSEDGSGEDYTIPSGTLTIDSGDTSGTITVPTREDDSYESDHYMTLTLTGIRGRFTIDGFAGDFTIGAMDVAAVGTITDAADRPQITIEAAEVYEEDGLASFVLTRIGVSLVPIEVRYASGAGTNVQPDADYTPVDGTLVFATEETAKTVDVPIVDDAVYEGPQTVSVMFETGEHAMLADPVIEAAIVDTQDLPTVRVVADMAGVTEGTSATFTVSASNAASTDGTVTFDLSVGGAFFAADIDDRIIVDLDAGETQASIEVATLSDTNDEQDGRVTLTLVASNRYEIAPDGGTATVRVMDDDGLPTVGIAAVEDVTEASGAQAVYTITVSPAPTTSLDVSVNVSEQGDFIAAADERSYTVSVGSGGTAQLAIDIVNDQGDEADGTVTATIAANAAYVVALEPDNAAAVSVTDDDSTPPGLRFSERMLSVDEGDGIGYGVRLAGTPTAAVTVAVTGIPDDLMADETSLTFTASGWNTAQTITITAAEDADAMDEMAVTLTHTATGGDYDLVTGEVTVTVADDDEPGLRLAPDRVSVTEGGAGAGYTVRLTSEPSAMVAVAITGNPDDLMLDETRLLFTPGNWNAVQTVTVTASEDDDGMNDTVTLTHTASGGDYGLVRGEVAVLIADNDVGLVLNPTELTVMEGSTEAYTVRLTTEPTAAVTVAVTGNPEGLTLDETSLTFTASNWDTAQTITVSAGQDADAVDTMAATLTHTASAGGYDRVTGGVVVTVMDDDEGGLVLNPTSLALTEGGSLSYTAVLTARPVVAAMTIQITGDAGTDLTLSTTSLTFTSGNWDTAQTVTVTAAADPDPADDRVTLTHAALIGGYVSVVGELQVAVSDPGEGGLVFTPERLDAVEGTTATYTVALTVAPASAVTVGIEVSGAPGVSVDSASLVFTTTDWMVAQTVMVPVGTDTNAVDETAIVRHTASGGGYDTVTGEVRVTVSDDDAVGLVLDPTLLTLAEGGSERYTVTLASEPTVDVIVAIAGAGDGLTLSASRLTFMPENWDTGQAITVTAGQDNDMVNNSAILTHRAAGGEYNAVSGTLDVTVADSAAGVTANRVRATLGEGDSTGYTLMLNTQPAADVTVGVTSDDTDVVTVDSASLMFTPSNWDTPQTVTVTGVDDAINNPGGVRTAVIRHAVTTGDGGDYPDTLDIDGVTVTVSDDDVPSISVAPANSVITEGGNARFVVTASPAPSTDLTINVAVAVAEVPGGGFVEPTEAGRRVVMLPVGETSLTYTVPTQGDDLDEPDGRVSVTVNDGDGYQVGDPAMATVTVRDDERTQLVGSSIAVSRTAIAESGANNSADITLTLVQPLVAGQELFIPLSITGFGSAPRAVANTHFTLGLKAGAANSGVTLLTSGTHPVGVTTVTASAQDPLVRFAGAGARVAELELTALNNNDPEETRAAFIVTGTGTGRSQHGLGGGGQETRTVSPAGIFIIDDDGPSTASITWTRNPFPSVLEDEGPFQPVVTLSRALVNDLEIPLQFTDETATVGEDYQPPAVLIVPGGSTTAFASITILDDDVAEGRETFRVAFDLANLPEGVTVAADGITEASLIIVDNDSAGLSLAPENLRVDEGGSAGYTVALTSEPVSEVTVEVTGHAATDLTLTPAPTSLTFTSANWNAGQTVTVTAAVDGDASDDTVTLTHTTDSMDSNYAAVTVDTTVTITDADAPGVIISRAAVGDSGEIGEASGADSYTVRLNTAPAIDTVITVTSDRPATAMVSPTSLLFTPSNWSTEQVVTVTGIDDRIDNLDDRRMALIGHRIAAGDGDGGGYPDGLDIAGVTVTVTDDDTADVTLSTTGVMVAEDGGMDSYTVVLDTQPASDVVIDIRAAMPGVTTAPTALTFTSSDWEAAQTVTVMGVDDAIDNDIRMVPLRHFITTGARGYPRGASGDVVTVTVVGDNDAVLGLRFSTLVVELDEGASTPYTVALGSEPTTEVTVTISGHGGTDLTPDVAGLTFTTDNWDRPQTVTLTAGQDADADDDTATLTHTAAGGDYDLIIATVAVTVTDDERPRLLLSDTTVSMDEGTTTTYTVALGSEPTAAVTVTISGHDGLALELDATRLLFTTGNWDTPQVVTLTANQDAGGRDDTVTLTHTAAGGSYGSVTGNVVVTVTDDDMPRLAFSMTDVDVDEGATTIYTVVLGGEPTADVTVTIGGHGGPALGLDATRLLFTTGNWDTPQVVTLTANQDAGGDDDTVTLTHTAAGGGYGSVTGNVVVTVTDDDMPRLAFSMTDVDVDEGTTTTYTVALGSEPTADVTVTIGGHGGTALGLDATRLLFTTGNWDTPQVVTLTANQDAGGRDDTVTLTHTAAGGGYGSVTGNVVVTVMDDDMPRLLLPDTTVRMDEGTTTTYTVALGSEPTAAVTVTISGHGGTALELDATRLLFTTGNWDTPQVVMLTANQDAGGRDDTVTLTHTAAGGGYGAVTGVVTVTITDDDDSGLTEEMETAQAMWLPRFGLMAVEHMLGGLEYRFSVTDRPPGLSGNVSGLPRGRALNADAGGDAPGYGLGVGGFGRSGAGGDGLGAGSIDRMLNLSRSLSLRDMLRGSRFLYSDQDGVSVWGQTSYSRYEDAQGGISVDGEVTTGMLGVDSDNGRTLLGLALSYSDGDGDWRGALGSGGLSSTLTSLLPYIRHNVTERLQVWGAASYGLGDLEQTSASGNSRHEIEQMSASAGMRGTLLERSVEEGGLQLTLTSDATLARVESDDADGVSGMTADTQQLRLGLEWSWQLRQADGGRVIPELELGMRYDDGDTSDGLGVELGGGISWELPARGLTLDLRTRRLLDHDSSKRREWGVSGSLRFDLQPGSAYGPSLSVRQEYGNAPASGGLDRLLSDSLSDALEEDSSQPGPVSRRWSLKGEWGLALDDGAMGVPYAGLSSSGADRDLTLGWRLLSVPGGLNTELDIKALRRRNGEGETNHGIGAQWKLRW